MGLIQELFTSERITRYIVAAQAPTVISLAILCLIAYKFGFQKFKYLTFSWTTNFIFIIVKIFFQFSRIPNEVKDLIQTLFDLTSTGLFWLALGDTFNFRRPLFIPWKSNFIYIFSIALLLLVGTIKFLPVLVPLLHTTVPIYRHIRVYAFSFPIVFLNFFTLYKLSRYFWTLEKEYVLEALAPHLLSVCVLVFSFLQFLSLFANEGSTPSRILLNVDNIGFLTSLLLKIGILVSLSRLIVYAVR